MEIVDDQVCKYIKDSSREIWNKIRKGKKYNIKIQEETITENTLLYLAENLGEEMKITTFNKPKEGKNGADWDWYIKKNNKWIGFRVQAKILNYENNRYDSLFKSPNEAGGKDQITKLITSSFAESLIPIYSFYNYLEDTRPYKVRRKIRAGMFPTDIELIGWTYAKAWDILNLKEAGENNFKDPSLLKVNDIMSNLFCSTSDLEAYIEALNKAINIITTKLKLNDIGIEDEDMPEYKLRNLEELPEHVKNLYENKKTNKEPSEEDPRYIVIFDLDRSRNKKEVNSESVFSS